ncbi:MAG TPA: carboxypeptidase-like regulatory domain-containing protein [Vicinamibacterales bacterium]|nr:carboxypeptidase-like regulatory domain-containing protein [Vicinamibacterales bacterium]
MRMTAGAALSGRVTFDSDPPPDVSGIEIAAVPGEPDFISLVDISLTGHGTAATGTVVDESGTAVPDVVVIAFPANRQRWYDHSRFVTNVRTSADGRFDIRGLPGGTYHLVAFDTREVDDLSDQLSNPDFLDGLIPSSTQVTLDSAQPRRLTLRLPSR